MSKKRPCSDSGGAGTKRGRYSRVSSSYKAGKIGRCDVAAGMRGIFATCPRGQEDRGSNELLALVEDKVEKLHPNGLMNGCSTPDGYKQLDLEAQFEADVKELQGAQHAKKPVAKLVSTGASSFLFVKTHLKVDPVALVDDLMRDIHEDRVGKTRYVLRMHPASCVCSATLDSIVSATLELLSNFERPSSSEATFAVAPRIRFNGSFTSKELIDAVAEAVFGFGKSNGLHLKVDLGAPDLTVVLEVFKNVCGVSVVKNYQRYNRFSTSIPTMGDKLC